MNNPGAPLPKIKENIVEYLKPDIEMYNNASKEVSAFDGAFEFKEQEV